MERWLIVGIVVGVAFTFTILCMFAGGSVHICGLLMAPGMPISVHWFHAKALGDTFFPLSLAFNTLTYSLVFGLALWLLRPVLWKSD